MLISGKVSAMFLETLLVIRQVLLTHCFESFLLKMSKVCKSMSEKKMYLIVSHAQCTFLDLTKWRRVGNVTKFFHVPILQHKRFYLRYHGVLEDIPCECSGHSMCKLLFASRIFINENPKILWPRGSPIKKTPGSNSVLNGSILLRPMGLNSPRVFEFHFSYFILLRCPSENLREFIVYYSSMYI